LSTKIWWFFDILFFHLEKFSLIEEFGFYGQLWAREAGVPFTSDCCNILESCYIYAEL